MVCAGGCASPWGICRGGWMGGLFVRCCGAVHGLVLMSSRGCCCSYRGPGILGDLLQDVVHMF